MTTWSDSRASKHVMLTSYRKDDTLVGLPLWFAHDGDLPGLLILATRRTRTDDRPVSPSPIASSAASRSCTRRSSRPADQFVTGSEESTQPQPAMIRLGVNGPMATTACATTLWRNTP